MNTPIRLAVLAFVLLVLVTVARVLAEPGTAAHPVGPTAIVLPTADPMASEMQAVLERGQREYAGLYRRLATAANESEAFAVQEDMRQQRIGVQVELLRIQAAYAHRAGRERLAAQLERAVAELVAPEGAARTPAGQRGEL